MGPWHGSKSGGEHPDCLGYHLTHSLIPKGILLQENWAAARMSGRWMTAMPFSVRTAVMMSIEPAMTSVALSF